MKNRKTLIQEKQYKESKRGDINKIRQFLDKYSTYREDKALDLLRAGNKVLDIGCGDGLLLAKLSSKYKSLWGLDISQSRLKRAKENLFKKGLFGKSHMIAADFDEKLPFRSCFFDSVVCIATLETSIDPYHLLHEINRIMLSGGILIIQVSNMAFFPRRISLMLGRMPKTWEAEGLWNGGALHYFTKSSLKDLLQESGFMVTTIKCTGFLSNIRNFWVSLLGADIIIKAIKK
ncbi:class I SAM-dependent methyltransferase [Candidatus Gottesmanbacteria bacterium]|nr:class I SAM-dependent methyltransferase [Candidatus Gottesmanbacteria bacterium]